jgi:hypothetical protein
VSSQPLARWLFALLIALTFGAFFVAQRLKHSPTEVQQFKRSEPVFSPNRDGRLEREVLTFKIKDDDDVTLEIVDHRGDPVRTLADERFMAAYTPTRFKWDGRGDDGQPVPDGLYRARITLRREGRAFTIPNSFRLDVTPPRPAVVGVGPERDKVPRPELLPRRDGQPASVRFVAPGRRLRVLLFRTGARPALVLSEPLADGARSWDWDGRLDGRPARAGTYVAVIECRDKAGNIGTSVPLSRRTGLPRGGYGVKLPGRGGITLRYLGVQPPVVPVTAGTLAEIGIDARGAHYSWSLRRVGGPTAPIARGKGIHTPFHIHARNGESGVYLFSVRARNHQQRVPLVVQSARTHRVLVVLPAMTWQGHNASDDDGDGLPDTLDRGVGVRIARPLTGDGLPRGFADHEAPVLGALDRGHHRYDITTDVALDAGAGPTLAGHRGVLIPGDARWLTAKVQRSLRRFVRAGGTLVSLGTESRGPPGGPPPPRPPAAPPPPPPPPGGAPPPPPRPSVDTSEGGAGG